MKQNYSLFFKSNLNDDPKFIENEEYNIEKFNKSFKSFSTILLSFSLGQKDQTGENIEKLIKYVVGASNISEVYINLPDSLQKYHFINILFATYMTCRIHEISDENVIKHQIVMPLIEAEFKKDNPLFDDKMISFIVSKIYELEKLGMPLENGEKQAFVEVFSGQKDNNELFLPFDQKALEIAMHLKDIWISRNESYLEYLISSGKTKYSSINQIPSWDDQIRNLNDFNEALQTIREEDKASKKFRSFVKGEVGNFVKRYEKVSKEERKSNDNQTFNIFYNHQCMFHFCREFLYLEGAYLLSKNNLDNPEDREVYLGKKMPNFLDYLRKKHNKNANKLVFTSFFPFIKNKEDESVLGSIDNLKNTDENDLFWTLVVSGLKGSSDSNNILPIIVGLRELYKDFRENKDLDLTKLWVVLPKESEEKSGNQLN